MIPEMYNKPKEHVQDPDRVLIERLRTSRKLLDFAKSGSNVTSNPPAPSAAKVIHSPHLSSGEKPPTKLQTDVSDFSLSISPNYTRVDNDIPFHISRAEWRVYIRLYRLSLGFHNNTCRISVGQLEESLVMSPSTIRSAVSSLCNGQNKYISIINTDNWRGNVYRVRLPGETGTYPSSTTVALRIPGDTDKDNPGVSDLGVSDLGVSDFDTNKQYLTTKQYSKNLS